MSPSSRRAWIEIQKGAVSHWYEHVALLAEGVDRNKDIFNDLNNLNVALLAEGVDRNESLLIGMVVSDASPSSRRAWIEIWMLCGAFPDVYGRPPRGGRG